VSVGQANPRQRRTATVGTPKLRYHSFARTASGHWRAQITVGDVTFDVDKCFGAWEIIDHEGERTIRRHVLPAVAAELQRHVVTLERRERRCS
jgi:hypothetical protein